MLRDLHPALAYTICIVAYLGIGCLFIPIVKWSGQSRPWRTIFVWPWILALLLCLAAIMIPVVIGAVIAAAVLYIIGWRA